MATSNQKSVEITLEIPAEDGDEFPKAERVRRSGTGVPGRASGLNGDQVLQLSVLITGASVRLLRTWLLARTDRLKQTRVIWGGREFEGYSADEIEQLVSALEGEVTPADHADG